MLGSVKPYARQVRVSALIPSVKCILTFAQIVISTGKSDWVREVTDAKGTLAAYVNQISSAGRPPKDKDPSKKPKDGGAHGSHVAGVFDSSNLAKNKRVTILNGSHRTVSADHDTDSVLVFPDYRLVTEVARTHDGAEQLWTHAVSPSLELYEVPAASTPVRSWIIPYSCVILLCRPARPC